MMPLCSPRDEQSLTALATIRVATFATAAFTFFTIAAAIHNFQFVHCFHLLSLYRYISICLLKKVGHSIF